MCAHGLEKSVAIIERLRCLPIGAVEIERFKLATPLGVRRASQIPAVAALVTVSATAAAQAQPSWNHIPYPPLPERSILTLPGPFRTQFIIMVNELKDPSAEIHQLFTLAAV